MPIIWTNVINIIFKCFSRFLHSLWYRKLHISYRLYIESMNIHIYRYVIAPKWPAKTKDTNSFLHNQLLKSHSAFMETLIKLPKQHRHVGCQCPGGTKRPIRPAHHLSNTKEKDLGKSPLQSMLKDLQECPNNRNNISLNQQSSHVSQNAITLMPDEQRLRSQPSPRSK